MQVFISSERILSKIFISVGDNDMGRKFKIFGGVVFGIGIISLVFQISGTFLVSKDVLYKFVSGFAKKKSISGTLKPTLRSG